jgi:hypothetical protein
MPGTPYDPIRQNILYPLENPDYAMRNAMVDVGVNPYSANPFAQAIGRLGRSSANSYLAQMAADNTIEDVNPYAIANQGAGGRRSAVAFSDYLRNTLAGGRFQGNSYAPPSPVYPGRTEYGMDASRGVIGNIQNAAGFLTSPTSPNSVINKIRDYRNALAAGNVNYSNLNPFLATLSERFGENGGLGTAEFFSELYAPYLAPSMASAFRRAMLASGEAGIRRLANEPLNTPNDVWTYMLGI